MLVHLYNDVAINIYIYAYVNVVFLPITNMLEKEINVVIKINRWHHTRISQTFKRWSHAQQLSLSITSKGCCYLGPYLQSHYQKQFKVHYVIQDCGITNNQPMLCNNSCNLLAVLAIFSTLNLQKSLHFKCKLDTNYTINPLT